MRRGSTGRGIFSFLDAGHRSLRREKGKLGLGPRTLTASQSDSKEQSPSHVKQFNIFHSAMVLDVSAWSEVQVPKTYSVELGTQI